PPLPPLFPYTTLFRSTRFGAATLRHQLLLADLRPGCVLEPPHFPLMAERAGPALCWRMTVHAQKDKWWITSEVQRDQSLPYTLRSEEHTSELQSRENL